MCVIDALTQGGAELATGTVLHIGAGRGAMLERYARLAPRKVVLVEGDEESAAALRRAAQRMPWAKVVCSAVAPGDGKVAWHRYNLPALNGPLRVDALRDAYPRLEHQGTSTVPVVSLSSLLRSQFDALDGDTPPVLVLDVPGQEARLLASLGDEIRSLSAVVVQRCAVQTEASVAWEAVVKLMLERAFELVDVKAGDGPLLPVAFFRFNREADEARSLRHEVQGLRVRLAELEAQVGAEREATERARAAHRETESVATARAIAEEQYLAERESLVGLLSRTRDEFLERSEALDRARIAAEALATERADSVRQLTSRCEEHVERIGVLTDAIAEAQRRLDEGSAAVQRLTTEIDEKAGQVAALTQALQVAEKRAADCVAPSLTTADAGEAQEGQSHAICNLERAPDDPEAARLDRSEGEAKGRAILAQGGASTSSSIRSWPLATRVGRGARRSRRRLLQVDAPPPSRLRAMSREAALRRVEVQAVPTITSSYESVRRELSGNWPRFDPEVAPFVSVVLTTRNAASVIEDTVESLLSQSYPNLEIVVVDSASTDATTEIVDRVLRPRGKMTLVRLVEYLGTSFARNVGILRARGTVLFFQEAGDISHPHRIALQVQALLGDESAVSVQCGCRDFDPITERVDTTGGIEAGCEPRTIGVRRSVFERIGYFDCSTEVADREMVRRIVKAFGGSAITSLDSPLYFRSTAAYSPRGREAEAVEMTERARESGLHLSQYDAGVARLHAGLDMKGLRRHFDFPRIRDSLSTGFARGPLANPALPVIVNVCSIPSRSKGLETVLRSLAPQCDVIHVYLDGYTDAPGFLMDLSVPIIVRRSQDCPGLRDNGKFLHLQDLVSSGKDAYYFTVDDDISYPPDYVNVMLKRMARFSDDVVVGVHGVTLTDYPDGYFSDRRIVYHFRRALERDVMVNVLGTGTTCFRASRFAPFDLRSFEHPGMADLYFAVLCSRQSVPQICVGRHSGWLDVLGPDDGSSLYEEFKDHDHLQSRLVRAEAPWGHARIRRTVDDICEADPLLAEALERAYPRLIRATISANGRNGAERLSHVDSTLEEC